MHCCASAQLLFWQFALLLSQHSCLYCHFISTVVHNHTVASQHSSFLYPIGTVTFKALLLFQQYSTVALQHSTPTIPHSCLSTDAHHNWLHLGDTIPQLTCLPNPLIAMLSQQTGFGSPSCAATYLDHCNLISTLMLWMEYLQGSYASTHGLQCKKTDHPLLPLAMQGSLITFSPCCHCQYTCLPHTHPSFQENSTLLTYPNRWRTLPYGKSYLIHSCSQAVWKAFFFTHISWQVLHNAW